MSHTPGPWHVCEGNRHLVSDSSHMTVASVSQIVSGNLRTGKTEYVPGHVMQDANSYLIAAAPDLLEACKSVVVAWDFGDLAAAARQCSAAIAKATGSEVAHGN